MVIGAPFGNNGAPPANTVLSQSMATVCTFGPNSSNVHLNVHAIRVLSIGQVVNCNLPARKS